MDSVAIDSLHLGAREVARTPARFRDRVVAQFRSPQNLEYLRALFARQFPAGLRPPALAALHGSALEFSSGTGRALDALASDPAAQRGGLRPAVGLWDEVRRLNRIFYEDRLEFHTSRGEDGGGEDGGEDGGGEDEPYHIRMFNADSLRPPGLEHLNGPGPFYALLEDQVAGAGREPFKAGREPPRMGREPFKAGREAPRAGREAPRANVDDDGDLSSMYALGDDAAWERGSADRTSDQAIAEYWGDSQAATGTESSRPGGQTGHAYGDATAWGDAWRENGGTRLMRYESIPFWQKGGRQGYDSDIEDTLGSAGRELGSHVRRWNMDRVREPRGQEYRLYGARAS